MIWRVAFLSSWPGRQLGVWETSREFRSRSEASSYGAWLFGLGACQEWTLQPEVST